MHHNLSQYGTAIDCGYITGISGFTIIATHPDTNLGTRPVIQHNVSWVYQPLQFNETDSHSTEVINVFATWASMRPYCRYCHSHDHALINCHLCNETGHISKSCPRKNESSNTSSKKVRKQPKSTSIEHAKRVPTLE
ncbi:hypothetical protein HPULCUR_006889 [Helicostylum pulchrum]|uniref:CCHC-type domain-containing protein n=1 Tax=Helicostylum pulchrum TaxID=562976 RepID=A0ABP9Y4E5_9FUNG